MANSETPIETFEDDPDLGPLVDRYGRLELEPAADLFERMLVSIVSQQLSTDAARSIRSRLFETVEATPSGVRDAEAELLADAGLSAQKIDYARNLAAWFEENDVDRSRFEDVPDEDVIEQLTSIRGVGEWTAKMTLMFGLGRQDVFPVEDLAIRRGMEQLVGAETRAAMYDRAERWRPYRSYAALYIWRFYADESSSDNENPSDDDIVSE